MENGKRVDDEHPEEHAGDDSHRVFPRKLFHISNIMKLPGLKPGVSVLYMSVKTYRLCQTCRIYFRFAPGAIHP
jgi:hypothetical protein